MTPEEWAERAIAIVKTDVPKGVPLRVIIEEAISAAVDEAVAGEREACAMTLNGEALFFKGIANSESDPNFNLGEVLTSIAADIRSRGEGEG